MLVVLEDVLRVRDDFFSERSWEDCGLGQRVEYKEIEVEC